MSLLFTFIFLGNSTNTYASGELNFSVNVVKPESQFDESKGYFDINLPIGGTENLTLALRNLQEEPIDVRITAHTAYTNTNGVVEYGLDAEVPDPTLAFEIKDLIEVPSELVTIEPNEEKNISIILHMPDEEVEGLLTGGLYLEELREEEEDDSKSGMVLKNKFSYLIGVVASNSRSQTIMPELELLDVFADQLNYRNVFSANIQNFVPTFVNELSIEATIRKNNSDEILYESSEQMLQMAPNSNFKFPISLEGDRFRSGVYMLNMTAQSGDLEWVWEETFEVSAEEARKLNREDLTLETTNWFILLGITFVVVLVISWLIYNTYKNKKQTKLIQEIQVEKNRN